MSFPLVVDRGISRYLSIIDFVSFRQISKANTNDYEAWEIRAKKMPIFFKGLTPKKKIGLHYLLSWSLYFKVTLGSNAWLQKIVDWIKYKASIKLIYSFILHYCPSFIYSLNLSQLNGGRRIIWLRLTSRNLRVYKRSILECNDRYCIGNRPSKRPATALQMYRNAQQCYG